MEKNKIRNLKEICKNFSKKILKKFKSSKSNFFKINLHIKILKFCKKNFKLKKFFF